MRHWIFALSLLGGLALAVPASAQSYGCSPYGARYVVSYRNFNTNYGVTSYRVTSYGVTGGFYPYNINRANYFGPVRSYYRAFPERYPGVYRNVGPAYNYRGPGYGFRY